MNIACELHDCLLDRHILEIEIIFVNVEHMIHFWPITSILTMQGTYKAVDGLKEPLV